MDTELILRTTSDERWFWVERMLSPSMVRLKNWILVINALSRSVYLLQRSFALYSNGLAIRKGRLRL